MSKHINIARNKCRLYDLFVLISAFTNLSFYLVLFVIFMIYVDILRRKSNYLKPFKMLDIVLRETVGSL